MGEQLRAPFPWYGGKSLAAPMIWRAFGNVPNYVEPFAGSLACVLARPSTPKVETVNDRDGFIANFWRAVKYAPDEVAEWCSWPVNEADLHARHRWLVKNTGLLDRLVDDPEFFDAKVAGWWCWGICTWIGNGWCHKDERVQNQKRRPVLNNANGHGIVALSRQLPRVGDPGHGVHAPTHKKMPQPRKYPPAQQPPTGKRPQLTRSKGVNADSLKAGAGVVELMRALADRLRYVRVCCGDWSRVLGRSTLGIDTSHGMTPCGIVLDPPYAHALRDKRLYREDAAGVSDEVREWALEHGNNPALRIALCGFDGEHKMPSSWTEVAWASTSSAASRVKERIWFSPNCLNAVAQVELFATSA